MSINEMIAEYAITKAETRIIDSIRLGYVHTKDLAEKLNLDARTIDTHLQNIYRKLAINGRGELLYKLYERTNEEVLIVARF